MNYFKYPLDLYVIDAEHIFNLKLYKFISLDKNGGTVRDRVFWRSIDIEFPSQINKVKKKTDNCLCTVK